MEYGISWSFFRKAVCKIGSVIQNKHTHGGDVYPSLPPKVPPECQYHLSHLLALCDRSKDADACHAVALLDDAEVLPDPGKGDTSLLLSN